MLSFNELAYLKALESAKDMGLLFEYRKAQRLQGYCILKQVSEKQWFVPMFVVHPAHRNKVVFTHLFAQLAHFINAKKAESLISHVLRNNTLSVNFHRRLGFEVTAENALGYEFQLKLNDTMRKKWRYLEKYVQ